MDSDCLAKTAFNFHPKEKRQGNDKKVIDEAGTGLYTEPCLE